MKKNISYLTILTLFTILCGCTKSASNGSTNDKEQSHFCSEISATLCSSEQKTKMSFDEDFTEDSLPFLRSVWSEGDAIVITPNSGDSSNALLFELKEGHGTSTGIFRHEGDTEGTSKEWVAYYPSTVKTETDYKNFPFNTQVQKGNDNMDHLSAYNLMKKEYVSQSPVGLPSGISFSGDGFEQSSCIKFYLYGFPKEIVPASLKFETYSYGTWGWSSLVTQVIESVGFSQTMTFTNMEPCTSLTAYMMVPSSNISLSKFLRVTITDTDGRTLVSEHRIHDSYQMEGGTYSTINLHRNWIYDDTYSGTWGKFQSASAPDITTPYCNIIIMGDGYTLEDHANNKFLEDSRRAYEAIFSVEPFKGLKDYFSVYYYNVVSGQKIHTDDSNYSNGARSIDTDTPLEVEFTPYTTRITGDDKRALYYTQCIDELSLEQACRSLIIVIANKECHAGTCAVYHGSSDVDYCSYYSIAYCALGMEERSVDQFERTVIHEAAGHGFGKLADEYPGGYGYDDPYASWQYLSNLHRYGMYKNIANYKEASTTVDDTPWSDLARMEIYAPEQIGVYEGAFGKSGLFCKSTPFSIMGLYDETLPQVYFNAISRKQIYHRAMRLSGKTEQEANNGFWAFDAAHLPDNSPYVQTKAQFYDASTVVSWGEHTPPILKPVN